MAKRTNFLFEGKMTNVLSLSAVYDIPATTLYSRLKRGWTIEEAVHGRPCKQFEQRRKDIKIKYTGNKYPLSRGKTLSLSDWAREVGVSVSTLRSRSYRKWADNEIIEGKEKKTV